MIQHPDDYTAEELAELAERDRVALRAYLHQHEGHSLMFVSEHSEDGGDVLMCEDCDRISDGVEINGLLHWDSTPTLDGDAANAAANAELSAYPARPYTDDELSDMGYPVL